MGNSFFRVNEPSVIHQLFDQELVAVHLATGTYHSLPGIAGEVFLKLGPAGAFLPDIAAELAARFDAPLDVIESDLETFVSKLQEQSLVVSVDRTRHADRIPVLPVAARRAAYSAPRLESFIDLQELVLLDPVHDVGEGGWPYAAPADQATPDSLLLQRCRLAGPNVIFERFDSETVVMNLGSGAYHSLSGAAEDIFLLFPNDPTTWEIRDALARKYTVDQTELETALRDYLDQLVKSDLIVIEPPIEGAPERELQLSRMDAPGLFAPPRLETVPQPSFDAPISDDLAFSTGLPQFLNIGHGPHSLPANPFAPKRYSVRPGDLLFSTAGVAMVISDRDSGRYFKLNEAASQVFRLLDYEPDVSQVVAALLQTYEVPVPALRAAVMILLRNLVKVGLATLTTAGSPSTDLKEAGSGGGQRMAFSGFDVVVYRDLEDLLKPLNVLPGYRSKLSLKEFVSQLATYFEETERCIGGQGLTCSMADRITKIRCAGEGQSAQLQKAFEHLATDQSGAGLTLHVWKYGSVPASPALESFFAHLYANWSALCGPRGEVLDFHCESLAAIFHPGPDTLSVVDFETGVAFYVLRDDSPLPFWELSSPFRHILHPWFSSLGLQYTHAGAVGGLNGGILLAGKGGSGKSTTSLLCAADGMMFAGDDYCLTDAKSGHVFSLYNTAKLKGLEDFERVPAMRGRSFNSDSFEQGGLGKGTFNLSELWPERMAKGFPLRAILLPALSRARDSFIEPCSAADALLALAPSTLAQLPASGRADCDRLASLAERVPAFRLHLGSDLDQIPALIRKLVG